MKYSVLEFNPEKSGNKVVVCESNTITAPDVKMLAEAKLFSAEKESVYHLSEATNQGVVHTVYVGIGTETEEENIRRSLVMAAKKMQELKVEAYSVSVDNPLIESAKELKILELYMECFGLISYEFKEYKTNKEQPLDVELAFLTNIDVELAKQAIDSKIHLVEGVNIARDTINMPANYLYPESFAKISLECGEKYGFKVTVFNKEKLEEMGCKALLSVGQGSSKDSQMVVMEYNGAGEEKYIALVGKGLTFDSGGYNLKHNSGISDMKIDMSGGGAVLGTMCAMAANKLNKNLLVVVPLAENLIGRTSYLPGSVIGSLAGKTIEIGNTDAEGRLILADGLYYAATQERVSCIVDIATLTGSNAATFGGVCVGIMGNDDEVAKCIELASKTSGEAVWRMPLLDEYRPALDSKIADISNMSSLKGGGSMTAGTFLKEFINEKPWMHIDMAGSGFSEAGTKYSQPGAVGFGTRLLYDFVVAF